jgi:hypothetical protein
MPRRIEVELTSRRDDGTWTWRAAGAREPRGVLDGSLLYDGVSVGDVIRAEADVDVDGITISVVLPPKEARREPERIELIRPAREDALVTSTVTGRPRDDRRDDRRKGRDDGDRRPRGDRATRGPGHDRPPGDADARSRTERDRGERGERGDRSDRSDRTARGPRRTPADRPPREHAPADRPPRERAPRERTHERPARPPRAPRPKPEETRPKPKRLRAARTHRKAVLEALPPEQRPIAEQVLLGGIPAVRQAIDKQNEGLKAEGKPEVKPGPLVAIAEELLPSLRSAEWRDKAEAALAEVDELDLRDLRSVVVASDGGARDEEAREMASQLREALTRRVEAEHAAWLTDLTAALADGRVVRALRLSSRPPKAGAPLPSDVTARLAQAAGAALTAETSTDRWAMVLEAVAFSPVRRSVEPASLPETPPPELLAAVRKYASRVPELAARLGVEAAPERPAPRSGRRRSGPTGRRGQAASARAPASAPREKAPDVAGPASDEVAVNGDRAGVPTREDESAAEVERAPAVVAGVADERDVPSPEPEGVDDGAEVLGAVERVGEESDVGAPAEPG